MVVSRLVVLISVNSISVRTGAAPSMTMAPYLH